MNRLKALWVEILIHFKKLLVSGIHRLPDLNCIQESVDRAFSFHTYNAIVAGDFNIITRTSSSNKMTKLIASYNAEQLITSLYILLP
jgi:endonuclease/exonuclease/phosphatase (EEP) superfamily protein YafD